ncbi:MAG: phosphatidylglycerophosphatase A [Rhodospirillales bacterium]|nr:phosphatidylglycerophosphatase A [Rhodospirillales bacterium]
MNSDNSPAAPHTAKIWNLRHPAVFLATGFGAGLLPRAPGTWGSILAVALAWGIVQMWGHVGLAVGAAVAFVAGVWASEVCIDKYGTEDPKQVVIDEIAGQWLVLLAVPPGWLEYALGFVLFRAFDIFKPWPVSWADRSIKGGLGVMVDDVLAAVYAIIVLFAIAAMRGA